MPSYAEQVAATRDRITKMLEQATQPTGWERLQSGLSGAFGTGAYQQQLAAQHTPDAKIARQGTLLELLRGAQQDEATVARDQAAQAQQTWQRGITESDLSLRQQQFGNQQAQQERDYGLSRDRLSLDTKRLDWDMVQQAAQSGSDEEKDFIDFVGRVSPNKDVASEVITTLHNDPAQYDSVTAKRRAVELISEIAKRPVPVDPEKTLAREGQLRDDYRTESKNYVTVRDAYSTIEAAAKIAQPTGASDMALVYAFMKMMDETTGVKEGEYANAENATGIPQYIRNLFNQAKDGVLLNPEQRTQFLEAAKLKYTVANAAQGNRNTQWSDVAARQGANPMNVIMYQQDDTMGAPQPQGAEPTPLTPPGLRTQPNWRSLTPADARNLDDGAIRGFFADATAMGTVSDAVFEALRLRGQALGVFGAAKVVK